MSNFIKRSIQKFLWKNFPEVVINHEWKKKGKTFDWENPQGLNEKIQWLLVKTDTSEWTRLADKYLVRDFVKSRGLEDILVKLYGKWDRAEDINYDSLPQKFILKCNHDSGSYHIIDKNIGFDKENINKDLNDHVKREYGVNTGEIHYMKIKRCIIAEELLESKTDTFSKSLVDYKVWCFNGKPYCIWATYNRTKDATYADVYDLEWNVHPEWSVFTEHYRNGHGQVPKPKSLEQMLAAAATLSEGFPEVRVDFYDVDGKLYFGEMTFTSLSGRMDYYTDEFLKELGDQIILPQSK